MDSTRKKTSSIYRKKLYLYIEVQHRKLWTHILYIHTYSYKYCIYIYISTRPFPRQYEDEYKNENGQKYDALHRAGRLWVFFSLSQLIHSFLRRLDYLLHVVVDSIKYSSLVDHEHRELFEYVSKFFILLAIFCISWSRSSAVVRQVQASFHPPPAPPQYPYPPRKSSSSPPDFWLWRRFRYSFWLLRKTSRDLVAALRESVEYST